MFTAIIGTRAIKLLLYGGKRVTVVNLRSAMAQEYTVEQLNHGP